MIKFLDKFFLRSNNLNYLSKSIKELTKNSEAYKIFDAINSYSEKSEIRYVGGCIRKIINNEKVDDIDLASNLEPQQVCEALKKKNISYFETGIEHGTITAIINKKKFEITSLRKDISTDGRHAIVKFTDNWKEDALRRDFTINSIYSDRDGNLFDPFNGKRDIENGIINFVGDADKRIKEDYLRILRYVRFFLNYSKKPHYLELIRKLKINDLRICIQCKDHEKAIGNKAVQEISAGKLFWKGTHAIIVSKSGFTKSAHQLAKSNKVELINEYQLKDLEKFIV